MRHLLSGILVVLVGCDQSQAMLETPAIELPHTEPERAAVCMVAAKLAASANALSEDERTRYGSDGGLRQFPLLAAIENNTFSVGRAVAANVAYDSEPQEIAMRTSKNFKQVLEKCWTAYPEIGTQSKALDDLGANAVTGCATVVPLLDPLSLDDETLNRFWTKEMAEKLDQVNSDEEAEALINNLAVPLIRNGPIANTQASCLAVIEAD